MRERTEVRDETKDYKGVRVRCFGRFSRRQRASSCLLLLGKIPINTISANIDYGFYTMPIKNSAISVKVWLNKGTFESENEDEIQINY